MAAFIALGLIGLALGVCAIFLVVGPAEETDAIPLPAFADVPQEQPERSNAAEAIVFFSIFLIVMAVLVVLAIRDHRRRGELLNKKPEVKSVFANTSELDDLELKPKEKNTKKEEDAFDLGLDL